LEEGLLTSRAISESISSGQVISSIAMFGFVYLLLLAVWIFVLNEKIQHGPEPITESSPGTIQGIVEAAAGRVGHNESLSETKD
jgi:cytochrome d ubiquinol oxidase subunit I